MRELAAEGHLADCRLADARVCDLLTLLIRLELLDRELAGLPMAARRLVDTTVCSTANEPMTRYLSVTRVLLW